MPNIPATWRTTQTANAVTAGAQSRPRITQLTNGNIVVVWQTSDAGGTAFVARIFDPAGNPITGELFRQYLTPDDNFTFPDVVAGPGGQFVTSYMEGNSASVFVNTWDASGNPVSGGAPIANGNGSNPDLANPNMAWSNANRVLTVYERLDPTGTVILGQISTPGSTGANSPLTLLDFAGGVVDPAVASLTFNGNFVIAGTHLQAGDSRVVFRIINPTTGATIVGPFGVNDTGSNGRTDDQASVSALAGGGFAIAWRSSNGTDSNIEYSIRSSAGGENVAGSISIGATDNFRGPTVISLADGSFIIAYDDDLNQVQQAAHISAAGVQLGTFTYAGNGGNGSDVDAIGLADGRFAMVWTDAATGEISLQILDTRDSVNAAGSDGVVAGTIGDDVIAGGASFTAGGMGNDEIGLGFVDNALPCADGGDGIDTLVLATQTYPISVDLTAGIVKFEYQSGQNTLHHTQLATNFENVRYSGPATLTVQGTGGANAITAGGGNDTLYGHGGNDALLGRGGNDGLLGGFGDDYLDGGEGNDSMHGEAGIDGLLGGLGDDFLSGGDGNDSLHGQEGKDTLLGGAGNDFLSGGDGVDMVYGGIGDDIYIADTLDYIVEYAGEGQDLIYAAASYALSNGQYIEIVSCGDFGGTAALDLGGNELGNILWGNAAINVLSGNAGNDSLHGFAGNDGLLGGANDDFLDGGEGDDSLHGGDGNDTLAGATGNDFLNGGAGIDVAYGGAGNDTYIADQFDYIVEAAGGGTDIVYATASFALSAGQEIETLSAGDSGGTVVINLTGNELANTLLGNAAANVLNGGGGADALRGYGGNDIFAFTTAAAAGNADTIADFAAGDRIALDDAVFSGIGTPGAFNAAAFVAGTAAADGNDRIVYNGATGQLFYDADGSGAGAAVLFATLSGNPALTANDFQVI